LVRLLWFLGYPDQALQYSQRALALAREVGHPFSSAVAATFAALVAQLRREEAAAIGAADTAISLCAEHGFAFYQSMSMILRGWVLTIGGNPEEGLRQLRQGLTAWQATGAELFRPHLLALLAEAYRETCQVEEGLRVIGEAFDAAHKGGMRFYEAELYRLKGELTLQKANQKAKGKSQKSKVKTNPQARVEQEAEECFLKAIEIARRQQAKSWELRAATSLARLWQSQGKQAEAHQILSETYHWFTEGFDTKDLQEAKVLIEELSD
jgi:predicted ATPase